MYTYDDENFAWGAGDTPSDNNRLMFVESSDPSGPIDTTYYYYNDVGNVERILTRSASLNEVTVTRLHYAANGVAVAYILGERWNWDGVAGSCPKNPRRAVLMQTDYSYSASGLLQRVTLGNGAGTEYTYDAAGQGWRWAKHNVRWERHQLPGYRNFHGGVCHLNIGKKHIIIDARVWWAKIKGWL